MNRAIVGTLMLLAALAVGCGGRGGGEAASPDEVAEVFTDPQRDRYWVMVSLTETLRTPDVTEEAELIKIIIVGFALASDAATSEPLLVVRLSSGDRTLFYIVTKDTFDKFATEQVSTEAFLSELRVAESEGELQQLKAKLASAGM